MPGAPGEDGLEKQEKRLTCRVSPRVAVLKDANLGDRTDPGLGAEGAPEQRSSNLSARGPLAMLLRKRLAWWGERGAKPLRFQQAHPGRLPLVQDEALRSEALENPTSRSCLPNGQ